MERFALLLVLLFHLTASQNIVLTTISQNPVTEGQDFVFNCRDDENTGITISYSVNQLTSGPLYSRVNGVPTEGDNRTFTFPDVTRDDDGIVFRCTLGSSSRTVTLRVQALASFAASSINEALFCNTKLNVTFGYMEGFPEGSVSVTKDGQNLTLDSNRGSATASGIQIEPLQVDDAGTYMVTSTNVAGSASATLSLSVYCGPFLAVGNNVSGAVTLNEGENFIVNCTVTSSIPPARIYLVVGTNSPTDITNNPVQTINDVKPNNAGTYVCRAESGQANTTYTYTLEVRSVQPSTTTEIPPTTTSSPTRSPGASPASGAGVMKLSVLFGVFVLIASFFII